MSASGAARTSDPGARRRRLLERCADRLGRRLDRLGRTSARFVWARTAVALVGLALVFAFYYSGAEWAAWLALTLTVVALLVLVWFHQRLRRAMARGACLREIKRRHLARLDLDWSRLPMGEATDAPPQHPYAIDLNVVGERSLQQLLDTTTSAGGETLLASWLLASEPDPAETLRRQSWVRELVPAGAFRDRLTLAGMIGRHDRHQRFSGKRLIEWLQGHQPAQGYLPWLACLALLSAATIVLAVVHHTTSRSTIYPFTFAVYFSLYLMQFRKYGEFFEEATHIQLALERFTGVAVCLERGPYRSSPALAELCAPFRDPESRPSAVLSRVSRLAGVAGLQRNQVLWLMVNALVPWDMFFAWRFQLAKANLVRELPEWLRIWHHVEALGALANYAHLHPGASFPAILGADEPGQPYAAEGLGHPLIPCASKVRNDLAVDALGTLSVVTGSNMSGKSTFLRTVGLSVAMAMAGGVVDARALRLQPFRMFTCIQVSDSVADGISYFYAEVKRLRALLEALGVPRAAPLFFLIDEIFRGTNNRERMLGTRAYVGALLGGHGTGLISTHDLELVALADTDKRVRNLHFKEQIEDGRMTFDYRLRQGPCPTTNALTIMRMEGLPVPKPGV